MNNCLLWLATLPSGFNRNITSSRKPSQMHPQPSSLPQHCGMPCLDAYPSLLPISPPNCKCQEGQKSIHPSALHPGTHRTWHEAFIPQRLSASGSKERQGGPGIPLAEFTPHGHPGPLALLPPPAGPPSHKHPQLHRARVEETQIKVRAASGLLSFILRAAVSFN